MGEDQYRCSVDDGGSKSSVVDTGIIWIELIAEAFEKIEDLDGPMEDAASWGYDTSRVYHMIRKKIIVIVAMEQYFVRVLIFREATDKENVLNAYGKQITCT